LWSILSLDRKSKTRRAVLVDAMPSKTALIAGGIALVAGTIANFVLPHIVTSESARGILGALGTGACVYIGLLVLERSEPS
jgi:hypothetical protein